MLTTKTKIMFARTVQAPLMAARRVAGLGPEVTVTRRGIRWCLDLREGIDFAIYVFGAFEWSTVKAYTACVSPGSTVLDIGANIGAHTLHMARCVGPEGRVIAFEPTDWAFEKLEKNLSINPAIASRVRTEQVMLSDIAGSVLPSKIYSSWPLAGGDGLHSLHLGRAMPTIKAVVKTLDGYVGEAGLRRVDLIKIDVDGAEYRVFTGGLNTLRNHRPLIVAEIAPYVLAENGVGLDNLLDLFEEVGYRLKRLDGGKALPSDRVTLQALIPPGGSLNVILTPVGR